MTDDGIKVEAWGNHVSVTFSQDLRPPAPRDPNAPMDFVYEREYAYEPNWLMRLLGDSLERRIERAKTKVMQRARKQMQQRERIRSAVGATQRSECVKRAMEEARG